MVVVRTPLTARLSGTQCGAQTPSDSRGPGRPGKHLGQKLDVQTFAQDSQVTFRVDKKFPGIDDRRSLTKLIDDKVIQSDLLRHTNGLGRDRFRACSGKRRPHGADRESETHGSAGTASRPRSSPAADDGS